MTSVGTVSRYATRDMKSIITDGIAQISIRRRACDSVFCTRYRSNARIDGAPMIVGIGAAELPLSDG